MSYKKIIRRAGRILKSRIENAAESIFRTHEQEMADFDAELKKAYAAAGHPERWKLLRYESGHQETEAMREEIRAYLVANL